MAGCPYRVELVIAGDLLHQAAVVFNSTKEAQVVEQHGRRQQAAHQRFQFVELSKRSSVTPSIVRHCR